jgi:two-component system phosphate regulon response regulator PhoB
MPLPNEGLKCKMAPHWQPRAPARIVVAEDAQGLRELVMGRLLDDGHEVYGASSASQLLHLLADAGSTIPPLDGADLIVLDHDLPGLSGIEIVRRLRWAGSRIPLLLMTDCPTSDLLREAKVLRVLLLAKPFSLADLSNAALLLLLTGTSVRDDQRPFAAL